MSAHRVERVVSHSSRLVDRRCLDGLADERHRRRPRVRLGIGESLWICGQLRERIRVGELVKYRDVVHNHLEVACSGDLGHE